MKCTRQRCQVAPSTLAMAAFSPSCASEVTSFTPRRPRRASERRNSTQNGSASLWPTVMPRSEEHTSELQSLMRISYAVFCLKKKKQHITNEGAKRIDTLKRQKRNVKR